MRATRGAMLLLLGATLGMPGVAVAAGDERLVSELRAMVPAQASLLLCAGDLERDRWVTIEADTTVEAASLIKIPIRYEIERQIGLGTLGRWQRIEVPPRRREPAGTRSTVEELAFRMIAWSDNAAANALVRRLGMDALNAAFATLGLRATHIGQPVGAYQPWRNTTTAREIAAVLARIYPRRPATAGERRMQAELEASAYIGRVARLLPRGARVGHKTGTSRAILADAAVVDGRMVVVAILRTDGNAFRDPLRDRMERAIARMARRLYEHFELGRRARAGPEEDGGEDGGGGEGEEGKRGAGDPDR